jgi:Rha family phage regulatory protein
MTELEANGLHGRLEHRSKHLAIVWEQAGKSHQYICPATPSDVRARINARGDIRRIIRGISSGEPDTSNVILLPQLRVEGDAALTNSRHVAEAFDKRHDHVVRDIDNLLKSLDSPELGGRLFRQAMVPDGSGIDRRTFDMTKQGFMLLAMGFTGSKAIRFKLSFIDAFEALERVVLTGGMSDALANAAGRIAKLEGEIEAVTDLLLEAPAPAPARKAQIIRPSLMRKLRRMA